MSRKYEKPVEKVACNYVKEDVDLIRELSLNDKYQGKFTTLLRDIVSKAIKNKAILKSLGLK